MHDLERCSHSHLSVLLYGIIVQDLHWQENAAVKGWDTLFIDFYNTMF